MDKNILKTVWNRFHGSVNVKISDYQNLEGLTLLIQFIIYMYLRHRMENNIEV